jgi:hypothetical protein
MCVGAAVRGDAGAFMEAPTKRTGCPSIWLYQNCVKTPSVWGVGSCYLSESSFPKLLKFKHFRME